MRIEAAILGPHSVAVISAFSAFLLRCWIGDVAVLLEHVSWRIHMDRNPCQ